MTVHLLYYKIVHHFTLLVGNYFWLLPVAKKMRHSTGKPDFFPKHYSTPNHPSVRSNRPLSLHRSKSCSTKI